MHWSGRIAALSMVMIAGGAFAQNTLPSSGNVGIGTTSPGYPLDVNGAARTKQLQIDNVATIGPSGLHGIGLLDTNNTFSGQLYGIAGGGIQFTNSNGVNSITILNNGNLGIGTSVPTATLDVGNTAGGGLLASALARLIEGNGSGDGTYLGVKAWCTQPGGVCGGQSGVLSFSLEHHFYGQTNSSINFYRGGNTTGGFLTFATNSNIERMRIDAAGNVGIGTSSPGYTLDVAGVIRAASGVVFPDGSVQTQAFSSTLCGGDYAESVDVASGKKNYEPGDVLIIASGEQGDIEKSTESYSTLVAGIYSTKPGVIGRRQLSAKSTDEIPMAMVGIVPTKVSAENGPIHKGDLLVTSSTPGYAMKGTDRGRMLGAVVGKAMGNLESGAGILEVLVTLQ